MTNNNYDDILKKIYYEPNNMWSNKKAVNELFKKTGIDKKIIRDWLERQEIFQIHKPRPKKIVRPMFRVVVPNQLHQFDILYMPHDIVYGSTYKYILTGIDVASRFKVARPLRTKKSEDVAFLLKTIYGNDRIPLTYPNTFQCDNGLEFKGPVTKLLTDHGVKIDRAVTKYHHEHTAHVESLNKIIAMSLFKIMENEELKTGEVNTKWVKYLYGLVDELNDTFLDSIGMKPKDAIKLDRLGDIKPHKQDKQELLPLDGTYRYLLKPGEEHDDTKRRATDNNWSRKTYMIESVTDQEGNKPYYYLRDGPNRSFVREELMQIPDENYGFI